MTNPLRVAAAVLATIATVLVIVLTPGKWSASAAQLMGPLRQPGEAAFIAAHRGDRADAPENTIQAFEAAVTSGTDFLETDVQLTADGAAVLMHDATVDRTTDGTGAIADLTLAQIRSLDAGSWYDPAFAATTVPTFAEFLDLLVREPEVTALVELKYSWSVAEVGPLLSGIYFRGLQDRIVFASFSPRSLDALQAADPVFPRVLIRHTLPLDPVAVATRYGVIAIMTRAHALEEQPDAVREMHDAGFGILLYTLNNEDRWGEALAWGVDGIITDEPSALDSWIAATAPGT